MTQLYLKDLKEEQQESLLRGFKTEGRNDLIEYHEQGEDICVGEYCSIDDCEKV